MIDQEYAGDTLKNLLVVPVRWQDTIKAKVAMLIGVCGVFVVNGRAAYWHPVTLCFSFLSDVYGAKSAMGYMKSGVVIFLYGLLCVLVYRIRYCRENKV